MLEKLLAKYLPDSRLISPVRFIITMGIVYLLWKLFSIYSRNETSLLYPVWTKVHDTIAQLILETSRLLLQPALGKEIYVMPRLMVIKGGPGIYVANHCLAVPPMVIFTGFVVAFGGNLRKMIFFIPLGVFGIFLINTFRISMLLLSQLYMDEYYFHLAHTYVYLGLTYGLIFLMLMWWMNQHEHNTRP